MAIPQLRQASMAILAMREGIAIFLEVYLEMADELIENSLMNIADRFGGHRLKTISIHSAEIPSMRSQLIMMAIKISICL